MPYHSFYRRSPHAGRAGAAGSSIDAANILKPALARGELQCIGATTLDEYRKHIESDAALERRFQPIMIEEPNAEETLEILKGISHAYEKTPSPAHQPAGAGRGRTPLLPLRDRAASARQIHRPDR
jgi:hypothetical protein